MSMLRGPQPTAESCGGACVCSARPHEARTGPTRHARHRGCYKVTRHCCNRSLSRELRASAEIAHRASPNGTATCMRSHATAPCSCTAPLAPAHVRHRSPLAPPLARGDSRQLTDRTTVCTTHHDPLARWLAHRSYRARPPRHIDSSTARARRRVCRVCVTTPRKRRKRPTRRPPSLRALRDRHRTERNGQGRADELPGQFSSAHP